MSEAPVDALWKTEFQYYIETHLGRSEVCTPAAFVVS